MDWGLVFNIAMGISVYSVVSLLVDLLFANIEEKKN